MVDITSKHIFQLEHFCNPERLFHPENNCYPEHLCHPEYHCHPERKRGVSSVSFIPSILNRREEFAFKGHPEGKARGISSFRKTEEIPRKPFAYGSGLASLGSELHSYSVTPSESEGSTPLEARRFLTPLRFVRNDKEGISIKENNLFIRK